MRKIKTQEEIDRVKKRNQVIIALIFVGLLVFSYLGYALSSRNNDNGSSGVQNYNGLQFVQQGNSWSLQIEQQAYNFQYLPQEVENISIIENLTISNYIDKPLYIVNNPNYYEIYNNLVRFVSRTQEACLSGTLCENSDLPAKTCNDNLIVFIDSLSNNTKVWQENNCVYISGDFVRGSDAFIYRIFGII
jgi:hypothetical protein